MKWIEKIYVTYLMRNTFNHGEGGDKNQFYKSGDFCPTLFLFEKLHSKAFNILKTFFITSYWFDCITASLEKKNWKYHASSEKIAPNY